MRYAQYTAEIHSFRLAPHHHIFSKTKTYQNTFYYFLFWLLKGVSPQTYKNKETWCKVQKLSTGVSWYNNLHKKKEKKRTDNKEICHAEYRTSLQIMLVTSEFVRFYFLESFLSWIKSFEFLLYSGIYNITSVKVIYIICGYWYVLLKDSLQTWATWCLHLLV